MLCDVMILLLSHQVVSNSFAIPWTVAHQAPLSMGFPMKEYWSELPFLSLGGLPDPGIKPASSALQADSLLLSHQGSRDGLGGALIFSHQISLERKKLLMIL